MDALDYLRAQYPEATPTQQTDSDPFAWAERFELTDEEVAAIADPVWAYENLLIQGHYLVLCAAPNGGKTTIMIYVAGKLVKAGYEVLYINADVAGTDAKAMHEQARRSGFRMLFPDLKAGKGVSDILVQLERMADSGTDLGGYVVIIDTLKKLTSLMDKKAQQRIYGLLRRLTGKGLTVCINSHTNKYAGADGMPVYEGTNDVRSDCDELIYLVATKDEATGELTVSTIPDKVRGTFVPVTFTIDANRRVTRVDGYVDVLTEQRQRQQYDEDGDRIALIEEVLANGRRNQAEVVEALSGKVNHKTVRRLLRTYGARDSYRQHWHSERGFQRNVWFYTLLNHDQRGRSQGQVVTHRELRPPQG